MCIHNSALHNRCETHKRCTRYVIGVVDGNSDAHRLIVWQHAVMPTVRSTKPDLDEELPIALAARIANIDRAALGHLIDHGLVNTLDIDTVRSLATSGQVAVKANDDPGHLVARLDLDPDENRIADMSDTELSEAVRGPHRVSASFLGHQILIAVRSFVIATGYIETVGPPVSLRIDRRGREIAARPLDVVVERRIPTITPRPRRAAGEARWLGRRVAVSTGGAVLPLTA